MCVCVQVRQWLLQRVSLAVKAFQSVDIHQFLCILTLMGFSNVLFVDFQTCIMSFPSHTANLMLAVTQE